MQGVKTPKTVQDASGRKNETVPIVKSDLPKNEVREKYTWMA
jgi:hypothetical protein